MKNYILFKCKACGAEFAMPSEYIHETTNYVGCPLHGKHNQTVVINSHDSLTECMSARKYRRNSHGAMEAE